METHGKNTQKEVIAIIPARLMSERLPGKLLLEVAGKPLILHTLERAKAASSVSRVIVAVDDPKLFNVVERHGGEALMTSGSHNSGSDRIAEVAAELEGDPLIVNVQGDEPMISPKVIDRAVNALLDDPLADVSTTCETLREPDEVLNPDIVKVLVDKEGRAIYFSRAPIPFPREAVRRNGSLEDALKAEPDLSHEFRKHTGLYVYRKEALLRFTSLEPTRLELIEKLEQLRALENGFRIKVVETVEHSIGIDTEDDLIRFKGLFEGNGA